MSWHDIDWGTVPDWVGGIGTTGALLLGLIILRREHRDRIEAQARLVSLAYETATRRVTLVNSSTRPILNVTMMARNVKGEMHFLQATVVEAQGTKAAVFREMHVAGTSTMPLVSFTDTNGRRWTLNPNNRLVRSERFGRRFLARRREQANLRKLGDKLF